MSSLLLAINTKTIGGLVGAGAGRKKERNHSWWQCLEELGKIWVLTGAHTSSSHEMRSSSHGCAVSFVSACVIQVTAPVWDGHLEEAVMCIGGRSPESFQGGKKPGLCSLGSSFPVNLRILCTGYSRNIMHTAGELIGAKIKWELLQFITLASNFHLLRS